MTYDLTRFDLGDMLGIGDLFGVILFATVQVPASTADRFKTLALGVKSAFSRFGDNKVFNNIGALGIQEARAQ
jgi:hypothetical protein